MIEDRREAMALARALRAALGHVAPARRRDVSLALAALLAALMHRRGLRAAMRAGRRALAAAEAT